MDFDKSVAELEEVKNAMIKLLSSFDEEAVNEILSRAVSTPKSVIETAHGIKEVIRLQEEAGKAAVLFIEAVKAAVYVAAPRLPGRHKESWSSRLCNMLPGGPVLVESLLEREKTSISTKEKQFSAILIAENEEAAELCNSADDHALP